MIDPRWYRRAFLAAVALSASVAAAFDSKPNQEFAQKATWKTPSAETVREQALEWLAGCQLDDAARANLETLWSSAVQAGNEPHLLDTVAATFSTANPLARGLVERCAGPHAPGPLGDASWLADDKLAPFERNNLRLFYGRWLVQESLVDEASEQLSGLKPEDVVDPAALLFYRAIIEERTLNREAGLATIAQLLENESLIPRRYASLARLMRADLEGLKDESLDHIARRMEDIRRRLDLGRAGPKVREVEDGVIASLDKLIEEMEKQQQQAAAAAAAGGGGRGNMRPMQPAQDSVPMGGKGPGDVAKKPIGNQSGWGNLPPHERQEALQQIGKDFPAHYRDMIEQYFRKLASEAGQPSDK
jgi:hypothetical protein